MRNKINELLPCSGDSTCQGKACFDVSFSLSLSGVLISLKVFETLNVS